MYRWLLHQPKTMGVQERRQREKETRWKQILAAAKDLFVTKGYEGTSIEMIASKLELSKRTIYLYFDSKDELYYAVAKQGMQIMADMFSKAASEDGNGLFRFANIGVAYAGFWDKHPDYRRIMNNLASIETVKPSGLHGKEFEEINLEIMETMVGTIEQGIKDGSIREDVDPLVAAFCISSSMQGVLQNLDRRENELRAMGKPRKRVIFETLDLFGKALASPGQDCRLILETMNREMKDEGGKIK